MEFHTQESNWDLVGNYTPVFFLRDPLKFPDLNHAQIPVNLPKFPYNADHRDGAMRGKGNYGSRLHYEPNMFGGCGAIARG